jgi:chemotaxis signal transduction protein
VSPSVRRQLLFEAGTYLLAADARQVCEVREPAEATPIPGSATGVLGLINLRGVLIVAGELSTLLGLEMQKTEDSAVVVLEEGGRQLALEVDRVVGVSTDASDDLDVGSELLEALDARDLVVGVGQYETRPYFVLDVKAIFARVLEQDDDQDRVMQLGSIGRWERQ